MLDSLFDGGSEWSGKSAWLLSEAGGGEKSVRSLGASLVAGCSFVSPRNSDAVLCVVSATEKKILDDHERYV